MASSASRFDDRTFVGFARQHMFVTVFGVIIPLLVFVCFIGFPIVYTIYLSFFEWNGMAPQKKFVGVCQLRLPRPRQVFLHSTGQQRQVADRFAGLSRFSRLPDRLRDEGAAGCLHRRFLRTIVFFPVTMSLIAVGLMFLLSSIPCLAPSTPC